MPATNELTEADLAKAIEHAVNFHSIDARLNMADFVIGELLAAETLAWLRGETDVQAYERMSAEDRAYIGRGEQQ